MKLSNDAVYGMILELPESAGKAAMTQKRHSTNNAGSSTSGRKRFTVGSNHISSCDYCPRYRVG
jgi:hypothetical protein